MPEASDVVQEGHGCLLQDLHLDQECASRDPCVHGAMLSILLLIGWAFHGLLQCRLCYPFVRMSCRMISIMQPDLAQLVKFPNATQSASH